MSCYVTKSDNVNIYDSTIGDDTTIGAFTEIGGAMVGERCKIQAFVFICPGTKIGDDVFLGPRVTFCNVKYPSAIKRGEFKGGTVEDGAVIGAGAIILPGVTIGRGAVVGAGAVVTKDVAPHTTVVGCPARRMEE